MLVLPLIYAHRGSSAFHPENTVFARRGWAFTAGSDDLRMVAVSRLMLDNVPNIKAYWIMISPELAQVALHFGVDDLEGTVRRERIYHEAGASTPEGMTFAEIVALVKDAGKRPVERNIHYEEVRAW